MKKIFSLFLILVSLAFATKTVKEDPYTKTQNFNSSLTPEQKTKLRTPLYNLFTTTRWDLFLKEFEMSMKVGVCCRKGDPLSCAFGLKAHMIEPIGYFEGTYQHLFFPFAKINLGGNILKSGVSMKVGDAAGHAPRGANIDHHFVFFPIMGMIFKKKLKFVCFHTGTLQIPYLSEFDPSARKDYFYAKLIPHMIALFTPQGLLSTILDCAATETTDVMKGFSSGSHIKLDAKSLESYSKEDVVKDSYHESDFEHATISKMNMIRNTMYYVAGCSGFAPVGGYVNGGDPITDTALSFYGVMSMLHGVSVISPIPFLYKQTNMFVDAASFPKDAPTHASTDTMCRWKKYPLPIPSQYVLQLVYPTVGSGHEVGASGVEVSTAHNLPGAKGVVYLVWERRDYYAFAYFCGSEWSHKKR